MKRFLRGFIFAFIAILSFTLISCGNEETTHEHTPSAVWSRDSASHWHACEVEGCDELLEFSLHTLSDWTKLDGECKEKRECTVCGFATTREIAHEFVDGLCVGCGLEEGNYEVEQFYVRGEHNGWGSPEEHALVYDPKTKTASIQITLEEGKKFKVADASWSEGRNFGAANCIYEAGLFEGTDDIIVLTTADYIITVSGYDTGEYSVEIKIACKHEFGTATPVEGKQCEFSEKCSLCGVVNQYTKHTFTDADIICDVCGHADLKVYYVKGSFNGFAVNEEFALEYDETTHTATVDLWLQVGHSFKIGTATGTDEEQWRFNYDTVTFGAKAKDAFIPDNDRNMYCVAKGADALGVKFTVTITGLNTINHTMTIDTEEEYDIESVTLPTVSTGLFVLGTLNGWTANDSYGLSSSNGVSKITLQLNVGDEFKIATADWSKEFNFNNSSFETGLFTAGGEYGNNLVVANAGTYTIIISGSSCVIVAGNGEDAELPDPVDETALYLRGTMNGWSPNADYKFTKSGSTSTLEVNLTAGDMFKITLGSSWDDADQWNFNNITVGASLFTADTEDPMKPNIVVNTTGKYKFTVTGTNITVEAVGSTGGNEGTDTPVTPTPENPGTGTTPTPENPDQGDGTDTPVTPTPVKSGLFVSGDHNNWGATDADELYTVNGVSSITIKLNAGVSFKVRASKTTWENVTQYHFLSGTFNAAYFEQSGDEVDRPNIKVKVAGEYKISITGTTLSAERLGDYTCVDSAQHTMVDATCEVAKHCSVTGCGYSEGAPLGHIWSTEGTAGAGVIVYPCTNTGCSATKEVITDVEQIEGTVLYLKPNNNWKASNPRYAVYTWDGGDQWFDMTDSNGDGIYEVVIPEGISNIIFVRMNPSTTTNNWTNKWNQTADLKVPTNGTNLYTVKEDTWDKGGGSWSTK